MYNVYSPSVPFLCSCFAIDPLSGTDHACSSAKEHNKNKLHFRSKQDLANDWNRHSVCSLSKSGIALTLLPAKKTISQTSRIGLTALVDLADPQSPILSVPTSIPWSPLTRRHPFRRAWHESSQRQNDRAIFQ